ncbi:MAG: envelope stress response membrane protein PspC [Pseudomonadota bacterium]
MRRQRRFAPSHRGRAQRKRPLYRDPSRRWIAGICAGIANHLGVPVFWVRLLAVLPLFSPLLPLMLLAYVVATFRIPMEPASLYETPEEQEFLRAVHAAPSATFGQLRHRMRGLEHRLRRLEAYVTSPEFNIEQDLKASAPLRSIR